MKCAISMRVSQGAALRMLVIAAACELCGASAMAQAPESASVERRRIAEQQAQARALFQQQERECQTRFAVTACVEQAQRRHREVMDSLARQSAVLDDTERRERASLRAQAIRDRVSAEEARQRQPGAPARETRPAAARERGLGRAEGSTSPVPAQVPGRESDAQRAAREARSRTTFNARQAEAQAHREAAERRAEERQEKGSAAAPLPAPSAPTR